MATPLAVLQLARHYADGGRVGPPLPHTTLTGDPVRVDRPHMGPLPDEPPSQRRFTDWLASRGMPAGMARSIGSWAPWTPWGGAYDAPSVIGHGIEEGNPVAVGLGALAALPFGARVARLPSGRGGGYSGAMGQTLYHGGRDIGDEGVLRRGNAGYPGSGQDSGAIFLTPSREYAEQYVRPTRGALYEARLNPDAERIFDAANPQHLQDLRAAYERAFRRGDYDSLDDALADHGQAAAAIRHSLAHGAPDWATLSQYLQEVRDAGFSGARFVERPGAISRLPDGSWDVSGAPVYSYGMFNDVPVRRVTR